MHLQYLLCQYGRRRRALAAGPATTATIAAAANFSCISAVGSKQKQGQQQLIQLNSAAAAIAALAAGPATTATIATAANFSCMKLAAGLAATPCGTVSTLHRAAEHSRTLVRHWECF